MIISVVAQVQKKYQDYVDCIDKAGNDSASKGPAEDQKGDAQAKYCDDYRAKCESQNFHASVESHP